MLKEKKKPRAQPGSVALPATLLGESCTKRSTEYKKQLIKVKVKKIRKCSREKNNEGNRK